MGMSYIFNNITNLNKHWFKTNIKQRLKDIYDQKWAETVFNNSTCLNYRTMTIEKKMHNYLSKLPSQYMFALCKFKCANHRMPIITGRYQNIPFDDRKCTLCDLNEIGDEFHYLLVCPFFKDSRVKYIKRYYYGHPNANKMTKQFNEINDRKMLRLAKSLHIILQYLKNG